nr:hypothetical protein [Halomonas aestuarii]
MVHDSVCSARPWAGSVSRLTYRDAAPGQRLRRMLRVTPTGQHAASGRASATRPGGPVSSACGRTPVSVDRLDDGVDSALVGDLGQQDAEFIAPETGHHILLSNVSRQLVGDAVK